MIEYRQKIIKYIFLAKSYNPSQCANRAYLRFHKALLLIKTAVMAYSIQPSILDVRSVRIGTRVKKKLKRSVVT